MKKVLWIAVLLLSSVTLFSCLNDDGAYYPNLSYVARGIDSIDMPEVVTLGERVNVQLYTTQLENCQSFQSLGYDPVGYEITVVTWFIQHSDVDCGEAEVTTTQFFFEPTEPATYHFRFWAGQDEETQEDIFITRDIVVE